MASYIGESCVYCARKKLKCDGQNPCSVCSRGGKTCVFRAVADRRRRKYHTDYVAYLESKTAALEKFIRDFVKDDEELSKDAQDVLDTVAFEDKTREKGQDMDEFNTLMWQAQTMVLGDDGDDVKEDPEPILGQVPLGMNGLDLYFTDSDFREHLIACFEENCPAMCYVVRLTLPELRTWPFSAQLPSQQLLMCSVFAIGCLYSDNPVSKAAGRLFMAEAEELAIGTCRYCLDTYTLQGLFLLSCYEAGMGNDSVSYLFDSMASSLTQHMGFHISYDEHSSASKFAPRSTPYTSALLWSICSQDRLITTVLSVPSCIHFKRIISPFYSVQSLPGDRGHTDEVAFSFTSRLWYILDRFMDQICSVQGDVGDTQQRSTLLSTGMNALSNLRHTLPQEFRNPLSPRCQVFHLTYHVCVILMQRLFLKELPAEAGVACINAARSATEILRNLSFPLRKAPYFFSYLVTCVAMIHIVLLIEKKNMGDYGDFLVCINALDGTRQTWKRATKDLKSLHHFAESNGYYCPELAQMCQGDSITEEASVFEAGPVKNEPFQFDPTAYERMF